MFWKQFFPIFLTFTTRKISTVLPWHQKLPSHLTLICNCTKFGLLWNTQSTNFGDSRFLSYVWHKFFSSEDVSQYFNSLVKSNKFGIASRTCPNLFNSFWTDALILKDYKSFWILMARNFFPFFFVINNNFLSLYNIHAS